jgi:subtilisin family serine protease
VAGKEKDRVVSARAGAREVEVVAVPTGDDLDAAIARIEADPAVAYAEPNWIYTVQGARNGPKTGPDGSKPVPLVDYYANGSLWGMYGDASAPANSFGSQAAEAWGEVAGSRTVYVGIIDEGVQVTHPDLDANAWTNPFDPVDGVDNDRNGFVDDVHGYDFANNDTSVYDGGTRGSADDHGTHVAGTIGAENGGELGVRGVNHSVTMISGKFMNKRGGTLANAVRAVDYFTDLKTRHGLNVVATNNSWGGSGYSQALDAAIGRANAAGILFVASAGNAGTDNDLTPSYPANYAHDNVISVAAIDKTGALADFSQYGATTVDLGAPGVDIWSTTASNTYSSYSGTSMAAPHVTGAAALYASRHPGASATEIRQAILGSTTPTASLAGRTVHGGRLDLSGF